MAYDFLVEFGGSIHRLDSFRQTSETGICSVVSMLGRIPPAWFGICGIVSDLIGGTVLPGAGTDQPGLGTGLPDMSTDQSGMGTDEPDLHTRLRPRGRR